MKRAECKQEKISSRTVGVILLPFTLLIAFAGFMAIPILGIIFALPILLLSGILIAAPESKVCRLISENFS